MNNKLAAVIALCVFSFCSTFAEVQDDKPVLNTPAKSSSPIIGPRAIYAPDAEYSEEARKSGLQGTVVLWLIVGPDGRPQDMRVKRTLGMGLDEKAMEAVRKWKFKPALKDGTPVAVQINVEVNFRLTREGLLPVSVERVDRRKYPLQIDVRSTGGSGEEIVAQATLRDEGRDQELKLSCRPERERCFGLSVGSYYGRDRGNGKVEIIGSNAADVRKLDKCEYVSSQAQ